MYSGSLRLRPTPNQHWNSVWASEQERTLYICDTYYVKWSTTIEISDPANRNKYKAKRKRFNAEHLVCFSIILTVFPALIIFPLSIIHFLLGGGGGYCAHSCLRRCVSVCVFVDDYSAKDKSVLTGKCLTRSGSNCCVRNTRWNCLCISAQICTGYMECSLCHSQSSNCCTDLKIVYKF